MPVISHLGAVVNFVAGKLDRAPIWLQRIGLEWLWRIKEEPGLWQRYAKDGFGFIRLVATRVIPYAWLMYQHKQTNQKQNSAVFEVIDDGNEIIISLCGTWELINLLPLRRYFASPTLTGRDVRIEFEQVDYVDSAFVGLLILLYSYQQQQGKRLSIVNLNQVVQNIFRYTCAEFLLDSR